MVIVDTDSGAPAVFRNRLGQTVCATCGERQRAAHESGETLLAVANPGTPFPLDPLN